MAELHYLWALKEIKDKGTKVQDRTGVGTIQQTLPLTLNWDLAQGFPCLTTKKTFWKGAIAELIWMCMGNTNVHDLSFILYGDSNKPNFWTPNYEKQAKDLGYRGGFLGPVYGKQLANFNGVNQVQYVIDELKANPNSRRAVISMWNPADLDKMALPPCHYTSVFNIENGKLNMTMMMRSNDMFLGAPFNYVFYAALMHCMCHAIGDVEPGIYSHVSVNSHIYLNQLEQVTEQIQRTPYPLPLLIISDNAKQLLKEQGAEAFKYLKLSDFDIIDYQHHEPLTAKMAV